MICVKMQKNGVKISPFYRKEFTVKYFNVKKPRKKNHFNILRPKLKNQLEISANPSKLQ